VQRQQLHPLGAFLEAEDAEIGDDTVHAAGDQPGLAPAVAAREKAGAGDKIDAVHEAPLLVLHCNDNLRQAGDVVAAAGSRQAGGRPLGIANKRAVEVAVLVDLRTTHKADIDIAALQQKEDFRAAEHHVGAAGAALLVGRGRQFARFDKGADYAALEQNGEAWGVQPLRQGCGQ
jgi:hypothetical protein